MRTVENECCDCAVPAYPCLGSSCPNRNVVRLYCDECGEEVDTLYYGGTSGKELCSECALKELEKVEYD